MEDYIIYKAEIDPLLDSDLEVTYIGLVENPATLKNFQAFNNHKAAFVVNEEKHIISGPAMLADVPIYRNDEKLGEYYVLFDKDTIQKIVEKFSAKGFLTKFNLFHNTSVSDITIFNSYIIDSSIGIPAPTNFPDLPQGSWIVSAKINNPDVWDKVKSGEIKGMSIEGIFSYLPVAKVRMTQEQLVAKIQSLLNQTEVI